MKRSKKNKYIVSFSGGKDSTAMLLILLEKGEPIDEVVYFDAGNWEFPGMADHIDKVEKYTGLKITRLHPKKSFDYWFKDRILTKGKRKGIKGCGFPSLFWRWCTCLKVGTITKYLNKNDIVYIGFTVDERSRIKNNNGKTILTYPLIEYGITERQALEICYTHGFDWGGLYLHFKRVSCWCCPLQSINDLRELYIHYPDLWNRLQKMQDVSQNDFRLDRTRIEDFVKRFEIERSRKGFPPPLGRDWGCRNI